MAALGDEVGLGLVDVGAHGAQSADVLLDPPRPDLVAAGLGQARGPGSAEERAQEHDRRPHPLAQLVGDLAGQPVGGDGEGTAAERADAPAQLVDDLPHQVGVGHLGDVVQAHRLVGEQGRRHDRQRCVLGPADAHTAVQGPATLDVEHGVALTVEGLAGRHGLTG